MSFEEWLVSVRCEHATSVHLKWLREQWEEFTLIQGRIIDEEMAEDDDE